MIGWFIPHRETEKSFLFDDYLGRTFWCPKKLVIKDEKYNIYKIPKWLFDKQDFPSLKKWKRKENEGFRLDERYVYSSGYDEIKSSLDYGDSYSDMISGTYMSIFDGSISNGRREIEYTKISESFYIEDICLDKEHLEYLSGLSKKSQNIFVKENLGKNLLPILY